MEYRFVSQRQVLVVGELALQTFDGVAVWLVLGGDVSLFLFLPVLCLDYGEVNPVVQYNRGWSIFSLWRCWRL